MTNLKDLQSEYNRKNKEIRKRLKDFKDVWRRGSDKDIFVELAFCICAIQTKASASDEAISILKSNGTLFNGSPRKIASLLRSKVRFHYHKARYIVETRKFFSENRSLKMKDILHSQFKNHNSQLVRDWLAENPKIMGLGYKE